MKLLFLIFFAVGAVNTRALATTSDPQAFDIKIYGTEQVKQWFVSKLKHLFNYGSVTIVDSDCADMLLVKYLKSDKGIFNQGVGTVVIGLGFKNSGNTTSIYGINATAVQIKRIQNSNQEKFEREISRLVITEADSYVYFGECPSRRQ